MTSTIEAGEQDGEQDVTRCGRRRVRPIVVLRVVVLAGLPW